MCRDYIDIAVHMHMLLMLICVLLHKQNRRWHNVKAAGTEEEARGFGR